MLSKALGCDMEALLELPALWAPDVEVALDEADQAAGRSEKRRAGDEVFDQVRKRIRDSDGD